MARSKKQNTQNTTDLQNKLEIINDNTPLSEEQVMYAINFARNLINQYPSVFTPMLVNQQMQNVTLNPVTATAENVATALLDPKNHERELIGYSENLEISDMLYKRLILYLAGILSFNLDWVCINAEEKDYTSAAYKKDYAEVIKFFDRFDVKREFKRAMREMVRKEAYFGQLRTDYEPKYTLQELPEDRCLIVGRYAHGLLFDFDMSLFLSSGVSLNMYGDTFKKLFNEAFGNNKKHKYDPGANLNQRDGSFAHYVQTNPQDGFVCFKLFDELATRIPFMAPMFPDILLKPIMRKLTTNSLIQAATKIIIGSVPYLKNEVKGASTKDQFAISAENLGRFLQLLRSGIAQEISLGAAPLDNINSFQFSMPERNILGEYTQVTASTSGVNSRLIYGYDKQNLEETRNSISVDEYMITPAYEHFSNWLEFIVNRRTKKFKWKFYLFGTEFDSSQRKFTEETTQLADKGIFLPGRFAAVAGVQKQDLERMMLEAKVNKWDEKLMVLLSPFQMSGKNTENGRPQKSSGELSEDGASTRENGGNLGKGGSI